MIHDVLKYFHWSVAFAAAPLGAHYDLMRGGIFGWGFVGAMGSVLVIGLVRLLLAYRYPPRIRW